MVRIIKCPRCRKKIELSNYTEEEQKKVAVFCSNENCLYHKNPLIGIDWNENSVYISEVFMQDLKL